jgi:hypothetical protein
LGDWTYCTKPETTLEPSIGVPTNKLSFQQYLIVDVTTTTCPKLKNTIKQSTIEITEVLDVEVSIPEHQCKTLGVQRRRLNVYRIQADIVASGSAEKIASGKATVEALDYAERLKSILQSKDPFLGVSSISGPENLTSGLIDVDCVLGTPVGASDCIAACRTYIQSITAPATGSGSCDPGVYACRPGDGVCPATDVDCVLETPVGASDCTASCGTVTQSTTTPATGSGSCDPGVYACQPGDGLCPAVASYSCVDGLGQSGKKLWRSTTGHAGRM